MAGEQPKQFIDTEITGTVEVTTLGNVGIRSDTGSTINPMTLTTGSVTFANSSGTVQIASIGTTSSIGITGTTTPVGFSITMSDDITNVMATIPDSIGVVRPHPVGIIAFDGANWDRVRTITSVGAISGTVGILAVTPVGLSASGSVGPLAVNASTQLILGSQSSITFSNISGTINLPNTSSITFANSSGTINLPAQSSSTILIASISAAASITDNNSQTLNAPADQQTPTPQPLNFPSNLFSWRHIGNQTGGWDRLRTFQALSLNGSITVGLLATGILGSTSTITGIGIPIIIDNSGRLILSPTSSITFANSSGTINLPNTSSITFANTSGTIQFPTTSTVGISFTNAQTGTIGAATTSSIFTLSTNSVASPTFDASAADHAYTSSAMLSTTAASTLLGTKSDRIYAKIQNVTITGTVYVRHGAIPTTTNFDTFLTYRDVYEINRTNLWRGNLQTISTSITSSLAVLDY